MQAEIQWTCLFCLKKFASNEFCEKHKAMCFYSRCKICTLKEQVSNTEYFCEICKSLCRDCKNNHQSNDHKIREIRVKSSKNIIKEEFRDGFSVNDPLAIYREKTIFSFIQEIKSINKILIRSPPFSGKTAFVFVKFHSCQF